MIVMLLPPVGKTGEALRKNVGYSKTYFLEETSHSQMKREREAF